MELLICLIIGAIVFLNPDKAEEYGKTIGSFLGQFKKGFSEIKEEKDDLMEPINDIKKEINEIKL